MIEKEGHGVRLSGPNNSTLFTTCCGVAITDRECNCPACGDLIIGWDAASPYMRGMIRWNMAYGGRNK